MQTSSPVMLVILDGFGLAPESESNAVFQANTPNFDDYWQNYPHTTLQASGEAVGLPDGQMGNSEVGHMNIGAGRVVMQSLSYLHHLIEDGAFFDNPVLNETFDSVAEDGALHLLGLVSDGGVHSDMGHLFALLELAKHKNITPVYVHVFTDGRDTAPDGGLGYVQQVQDKIDSLGHDIHIASVSGRYYAMDRDKRWQRLEQAYNTIVCGQAEHQAQDAVSAVQAAYDREETDEFILPTVITDGDGQPVGTMNDGDAAFFFNFRADRVRQIVGSLLAGDDWDAFERCAAPKLTLASMMQYDETFDMPFAFSLPEVNNCLAQVLSDAGKTQFHTAETEKYPHVTYFFNAKIEEPFPGETRNLVPSPKVATYDLQPEMSAPELTQATLERIQSHNDDFILVNFANPDMVGHTGVLEAAIKACGAADEGLGKLVNAVRGKGGKVIIIADHGNADVMRTPEGNPHTAHTTNLVPCVLVGDGLENVSLHEGVLGDVAPTVLELLGLAQPADMTGRSLIDQASE